MDDIASIESVQPLDQLSFWCLTFSSMLKLVAMGVTIFVLPFNKWILLQRPADDADMLLIRGIAGLDCVYASEDSAIQCMRWADLPERRHKFWAKFGLDSAELEQPGGMFRSLYYLVLLQLFLFLLDIGATLVMCCRYKAQKEGPTLEKRVSLALSGAILFFYALVSLTALAANSDFTRSRPPLDSCLGTAFKLYTGMFLLFGLGCLLAHCSRLVVLRDECRQRRRQGNGGGGGGNGVQRSPGRKPEEEGVPLR